MCPKNTSSNLQERGKTQSNIIIQYKNIIDNFSSDVYWKDKDGVWLGLNRHCLISLTRMGIIKSPNEDEVIGKTDYELFNKITADSYRANDLRVMNTQQEIAIEETVHTTGEQINFIHSIKKPLYDEHQQVIGVIGNTIDITHLKSIEQSLKKAKEQAENANQAKAEFLTNMRHDIRTPLSGIVGFSELLKSESTEPRIKEYADNLITSSHALLNLMDEVLEAVRVSTGEIPMLKRKFNLMQTFDQVISLNQARAQEKKLNLSLTVDGQLPHFVIGDKIRLHRIALELIGNALNFTDRGHVSINVLLAKKYNRELVVKLTVTDSGMGIPKDKQQEIYLQFKRLTHPIKVFIKVLD